MGLLRQTIRRSVYRIGLNGDRHGAGTGSGGKAEEYDGEKREHGGLASYGIARTALASPSSPRTRQETVHGGGASASDLCRAGQSTAEKDTEANEDQHPHHYQRDDGCDGHTPITLGAIVDLLGHRFLLSRPNLPKRDFVQTTACTTCGNFCGHWHGCAEDTHA